MVQLYEGANHAMKKGGRKKIVEKKNPSHLWANAEISAGEKKFSEIQLVNEVYLSQGHQEGRGDPGELRLLQPHEWGAHLVL